MTICAKVQQALTSLRSLEGQLETFASDSDDQQAKQMFKQCHQQLVQVTDQITNHVNSCAQEEPPYKSSGNSSGCCGDSSGRATSVSSSAFPDEASMTGLTNLDTTGFGLDSSIGSTAGTGFYGNSDYSSPTNTKGSSKPTKKKSW